MLPRPQTPSLAGPPFRCALRSAAGALRRRPAGARTSASPCFAYPRRDRSAPRRRGPGLRPFDAISGTASAPLPVRFTPRFAPFRPASRRRLLDCPAANVSRPKQIPAGRDGADWSPTDSPSPATHRWRGRRFPAAHSQAHSQPGRRWSAPKVRESPSSAPAPVVPGPALATAGEASARASALRRAPSARVASTSHVARPIRPSTSRVAG
jgi:hypothetical protein